MEQAPSRGVHPVSLRRPGNAGGVLVGPFSLPSRSRPHSQAGCPAPRVAPWFSFPGRFQARPKSPAAVHACFPAIRRRRGIRGFRDRTGPSSGWPRNCQVFRAVRFAWRVGVTDSRGFELLKSKMSQMTVEHFTSGNQFGKVWRKSLKRLVLFGM